MIGGADYLMASESYEKLLDRALAQIPKKTSSGERFEVPKPSCVRSGSRTIVNNFKDICEKLNRDPKHLLRFLSKEMATAGSYEGDHVIFQGKFGLQSIERLIQIYVNRFVICPVCGRPDTKIEKEGRFHFLVCDACGAKSSVLLT